MKTKAKREYDLVKNDPVAVFFYQGGSHTHPVKREVLVVDDLPELLIGYELREGSVKRRFKDAPIKSYRKDRIAKYGDYSRLRQTKTTYNKKPGETTLVRKDLVELLKERL